MRGAPFAQTPRTAGAAKPLGSDPARGLGSILKSPGLGMEGMGGQECPPHQQLVTEDGKSLPPSGKRWPPMSLAKPSLLKPNKPVAFHNTMAALLAPVLGRAAFPSGGGVPRKSPVRRTEAHTCLQTTPHDTDYIISAQAHPKVFHWTVLTLQPASPKPVGPNHPRERERKEIRDSRHHSRPQMSAAGGEKTPI